MGFMVRNALLEWRKEQKSMTYQDRLGTDGTKPKPKPKPKPKLNSDRFCFTGWRGGPLDAGAKNALFAPFYTKAEHFDQDGLGTNIGKALKTIDLPRQARGKHRENSKRLVFSYRRPATAHAAATARQMSTRRIRTCPTLASETALRSTCGAPTSRARASLGRPLRWAGTAARRCVTRLSKSNNR